MSFIFTVNDLINNNNNNNNMYAGRKRRKPAQKGAKPAPAEGAKSNPSKRHRDRLNSELDRLASLLPFPEDVISSLDKLSILRLSVSFLRNKSFFSAALKNQLSNGTSRSGDHMNDSRGAGPVDDHVPEGELLLQALNGFVLVVTAEGMIFFCSHTIQDYLGFHQTDVMHQSVFELIHAEDLQEFRRNLHWAPRPPLDPSTEGESASTPPCLVSYSPDQIPPENSSFLERGFICRFRCLLDNSSGFLALNIQGRLKFLHSQSRQHCGTKDGTPPQLALFAVATPLQPPAILEIRTRNMIFRTKHKLDFTPMACDAKGKIVLGYTEAELRVRGSGYQFIHAADMLHCAENHVRMMKTGESGLTVFRLLTKDNRWKWVQANARLVYKNGKPDYIIATQRPLVDEEGGEHLRKRSMHLPFTFATGEALLYQTGYPLHSFPDSSQGKANGGKSKKGKLAKSSTDELDPKSLLGALMSQDESVYVCQPDSKPRISYYGSHFSEQQAESDGCGALMAADNWHVTSNGETGRCNGKTSSYDPLLATLDSLSLDGDETCSNSELFSALENLGLNAEDLELLLLDERMIQVELDPSNIPTLSDLLTNNEILSYIQDSLESSSEGEGQGSRGRFGLAGHQAHPDSAPSVSQQACLTPPVPAALPSSRQPIVQLSQQMQQRSSAGELPKGVSQPRATDRPNGHWAVSTENQLHHQQHPVLKASQLNGEHKDLHSVVEVSQQWQLQQHQHPVHLQSHQVSSALLPGYQNQLGATTAGPTSCYSICSTPHAADSAQTGVTTSAFCHYQSPPQLLQTQVPPSRLPQCPPQSSALELEQFLGLPSLEAYSMFSPSSEESSPSKLENSCLASAAYAKTCLVLNGNGAAATNIPVSGPEGPPDLQDPPKSGFFL